MLKGYFNDSNILNNFRHTRLFWSYILKELNLTFTKSFVYYVKVYLKVLLLLIFTICQSVLDKCLMVITLPQLSTAFMQCFAFLFFIFLSLWFCSFLRLRSFWALQDDEYNFLFHVLKFVLCSLAKSNHIYFHFHFHFQFYSGICWNNFGLWKIFFLWQLNMVRVAAETLLFLLLVVILVEEVVLLVILVVVPFITINKNNSLFTR